MPSFVTVTSGNTAQAQDVNQIINALNGSAGNGVPLSLTALNDSVNFSLAVKNADPTNSRALQVLRSNNNVLLQADVNGVVVSPDGGAATAQVVNTTFAQTLSNKTLVTPSITYVAASIPRGTISAVAMATFTPGLIQNAGLTLSNAAGRYMQIDKMVFGTINITINSVGLSGSAFNLTGLPVAAQVFGSPAWGWYNRTASTVYPMTAIWNTTTSIQFYGGNGTGLLGVNPAFAAAVGDTIALNFCYEAA